MQEAIGVRVRQARSAAGLTQRELAIATGLSCATVSLLERGRILDPRTTTIDRLSDALRVDPLWLSRGVHSSKVRQRTRKFEVRS